MCNQSQSKSVIGMFIISGLSMCSCAAASSHTHTLSHTLRPHVGLTQSLKTQHRAQRESITDKKTQQRCQTHRYVDIKFSAK